MTNRRLCAVWAACVAILAGGAMAARGQATRPADGAAVWDPATRPAFVIACYQQPAENFATWRGRGCNAVVGPEVGNPPRMSARQWCEAAAREGLWVIGNRQLLEAGYRPPNLLAWALDDEPNSSNHNTSPPAVRAQAEAFRRLAADVPVWLNLAGDRVTSAGARDQALYEQYCAAADVVSEDWYPINREFARYPIALKGQALEYLSARGARALWSVVECNWQKLNKASPKGRGPTPDEIEQSVALAVSKGARGIVYFSTCDSGAYGWPASYDPTEPAQAARIGEINARLAGRGGGATRPTTVPATQPGPVPDGEIVTLRAEVAALRESVVALRESQRAAGELLVRGGAELLAARAVMAMGEPVAAAGAAAGEAPASAPTTMPTTVPVARGAAPVYAGITGGRVLSLADRRVAPTSWLHMSLWNNTPTPVPAGKESPYDIPLENARWIGSVCRDGGVVRNTQGEAVPLVAGTPIVVDFEGYYHDAKTGRPVSPERMGKLAALVREIRKAAAPGQVIAINAISPFAETNQEVVWNGGRGPTEAHAAELAAGYAAYKPLLDEVDAIVGDFCVLAPETAEKNLAVAGAYAAIARRATGKPFWGLVDSAYRGTERRMTPEDARRNLAAARAACDGVWIWSGYDDARATYLPLLDAGK